MPARPGTRPPAWWMWTPSSRSWCLARPGSWRAGGRGGWTRRRPGSRRTTPSSRSWPPSSPRSSSSSPSSWCAAAAPVCPLCWPRVTCHVSVPRVAECPCYRDTSRNKVGPATEEDIQVLTVRDGEGKQLQDARFVEILKSAKSRIRSATDSLRQVGTVDRCPAVLHCPCRAEGAGSAGGRRGPGTGGGGGGCPCPAWTTST